jgi:short-subunit dehydrogenase
MQAMQRRTGFILSRREPMPTVSTFARKFGPWALVTGASSGIGAEFVRKLAAEGFNVALAARRDNLLQAVAEDVERRHGIATKCVVADLSEDTAVDILEEQLRGIDIGLVISNAGSGQPGHFLEQDHRELLERFRLNALSHLNIAYAFCTRLAQRGGGGLILGGALGAAQGIPFAASDAGSKALVQSLGESLHVELKRKHVQVMTLIVPPTNTAIITRFGLDPADMPMKPMSVEQCVSEALRHFKQGRSLSLPGALNRFLMGIMPIRLMRVMMGKVIEQTLAKNARRAAQAAR